jgi:hypothetical protein
MDPFNRRLSGLEKMLAEIVRAFRERAAARRRRSLSAILRAYSLPADDSDLDDASDALVGARLRPRQPLAGSAIALPEPDPERFAAFAARCERDMHYATSSPDEDRTRGNVPHMTFSCPDAAHAPAGRRPDL